VLDLIAGGRGNLPLPAVQAERRRLLARAHRRALARSLRALADEAQRRHARPIPARPLYTPRVLAALARELHATAQLIESHRAGLAGLAMTERLLTAHDSPL
jgi:hypothetical protein